MVSVWTRHRAEQFLAVVGNIQLAFRRGRMEIVQMKVNAPSADSSMSDADVSIGDRREIHDFETVAILLDHVAEAGTRITPRTGQHCHRLF